MAFFDMDRKYYQPIWRCIYCGSEENPRELTKEHIIPKSLGGRSVLPKSSCNACRDITRIFEQDCTRPMLGPLRIIFDLPTDHPHERPTELPIKLLTGTKEQDVLISVEDYPLMDAWLPSFEGLPTILRHGHADNAVAVSLTRVSHFHPEHSERIKRLKAKFGAFDKIVVSTKTIPVQFCRMLAKIAHSFAYAELDSFGFTPLLANLICVGGGAEIPKLIGQIHQPLRPVGPEMESKAHRLDYGLARIDGIAVDADGPRPFQKSYLAVTVSLFQHSGWPIYYVIVGEPSPQLEQFLSKDASPLTL